MRLVLLCCLASLSFSSFAGDWANVNAHPNVGTDECSVGKLVQYGVPKEQAVILKEKIAKRDYREGRLTKGGNGIAMIHGKCEVMAPVSFVWNNVAADFLPTEVYETEGFEVHRYPGCNNFVLVAKQAAPRPVAAAVVPIKLKGPNDGYTVRVMVWLAAPELLNEIRHEHSRNLGDIVNNGVKEGRLRPFSGSAGVFEVELHDLNWDTAKGSKVGVNNKYRYSPGAVFPGDFSARNNVVEIPVNDGEGQLTFERVITNEESHLIIRAPAALAVSHPQGSTLYTCVSKTAGRCGGSDHGKWNREVKSLDWTRYHFFVEAK